MFKEGKWKIELKRNGRIRKLGFNNLILDSALSFNFDYKANSTNDSIITHMFLSTAHTDVKGTDTNMGGGVVAAVPYVDYITPNYDNPNANVYENELVFKYKPTETVSVKQVATGRPGSPNNRYFSIANILNEEGELAELQLKPGDELTFRYVLTLVGNLIDMDFGNSYVAAMESKVNFNNILKANPNWSLSGFQKQLEALAPVVSEFLGVPVTPSFEYVYNYPGISSSSGQTYTAPLYSIKWRTVSGLPFTGVDGIKFSTEFFANLVFPYTRTYINSNQKTPPTGNTWGYTQQFGMTPGVTAVDRFDHTKVAPILPPKTPDSFEYVLRDAVYYNHADTTAAAAWVLKLKGAEPLSQVFVVQNNKLALSTSKKLLYVDKQGNFEEAFRVEEIKRNQPFFIYFFNKAGQFKYGPLFVQDTRKDLRGHIAEPKILKGADVSTRFYPSTSYNDKYLYVSVYGRVNNDLGGKTVFMHVVTDKSSADDPAAYKERSNYQSSAVGWNYTIPFNNRAEVDELLANPNAAIRLKFKREDVEFYEFPIKLLEIDPSPTENLLGSSSTIDAVVANFKFKKI